MTDDERAVELVRGYQLGTLTEEEARVRGEAGAGSNTCSGSGGREAGGRMMTDKRDVCGCHRTCTGPGCGCGAECRWPECLTEAEAEELAREVFTDLSPADVTRLRREEPGGRGRFQVSGWNRGAREFSEPVDIRCLLCGVASPEVAGALLSDLTEWAARHHCPGLRVT